MGCKHKPRSTPRFPTSPRGAQHIQGHPPWFREYYDILLYFCHPFFTPKNNRPRFAISTESSKSRTCCIVQVSLGSRLLLSFPLLTAVSNATFLAVSEAIFRGSLWPVNITIAERGGRAACSTLRRVFNEFIRSASFSGEGGALGSVGGASFGVSPWSS